MLCLHEFKSQQQTQYWTMAIQETNGTGVAVIYLQQPRERGGQTNLLPPATSDPLHETSKTFQLGGFLSSSNPLETY